MPLNPMIPMSGSPPPQPMNLMNLALQGEQLKTSRMNRTDLENQKKTLADIWRSSGGNLQQTAQGMMPLNPQLGMKMQNQFQQQKLNERDQAKYEVGVLGSVAPKFLELEDSPSATNDWNMTKEYQWPQFVNYLQKSGVRVPDEWRQGFKPEYSQDLQRAVEQYQGMVAPKGNVGVTVGTDAEGNYVRIPQQMGAPAEKVTIGDQSIKKGYGPGVTGRDMGDRIEYRDKSGNLVESVSKGISPEKQPYFLTKQEKAKILGKVAGQIETGTIIPETEKIAKAKKKVTSELVRMKDAYENLRELKGIVDLDNTSWDNFFAKVKSSGIGQAAQNAIGTKAQSLRNEIKAIKPNLINAVRQATNMGAKGMDSEKELEFYLQTVTNEKKDFQSNMAAIAALDRAYGLNIGMEINPELKEKLDALDQEFNSKYGYSNQSTTNPPKNRRKATMDDF